jgi:hypothetical protein
MPTQRTDKERNDRIHPQQPDLKLPLQQARQVAHPLVVEGPEGVRDSHC